MNKLWQHLSALALSLALLTTVLVPAAWAAEAGAPASTSAPAEQVLTLEERAQQAAEAALQFGGATSLRYALWDNGEIVLSGGAGSFSLSEDRALTEDTLYGVGSVSKVYTASAVLRLADQGKLDLDTPVVQYLPGFKMADERYTSITVRMLLNHSSGLMGTNLSGAFVMGEADGSDATDTLLANLANQRLKADPGAYSVYCNDGFTLAELVVEAVSGMDFTSFVRQEFLTPMELSGTFTPDDTFDRDRLARIYLPGSERALAGETVTIIGTGGIYATAEDLAAFGGLLTSEASPLSKESLEAMAVNEAVKGLWPADSEDDALAYGLGWDSVDMFPFSQSGVTALVKGGDTQFYHCGLVVLPEYGLSAAVLSSGGVSIYNELAGVRMLIDVLAEKGVTVAETDTLPEAEPAEMPAELTALSGVYGSSSSTFDIVVAEDGTLTLTQPAILGGGSQSFSYASDGSFRDWENDIMVKLVEDQGKVYFYQKTYASLPGLSVTGSAAYAAMKLENNPISEEVKAAWEAREGKMYFQLNEPYNSSLYPLSAVLTYSAFTPNIEGYIGSNQIMDENHVSAVAGIPGTAGRDWIDVAFEVQDGVEYLTSPNGYRYIDSSVLPEIFPGALSYCTIQSSGEARWHMVGAAAGRTMTVEVPEHAGFTVYDANFQLVASSVAYGDTSAVLPEGGFVVFAGAPGARFVITME